MYSYFGISSYINLAISMKVSVVSVNTIHTNKQPINSRRISTNKLYFVNPW